MYVHSDFYKKFKENVLLGVRVPAVVYVPGMLLTALCFPYTKGDIKYPHMDLFTQGDFKSHHSN